MIADNRMENSIQEIVNGYTRILQMTPAFDRRSSDQSKNYGIHGMEILFVLVKDHRAVNFLIYTGIHLPHVAKYLFTKHCNGTHNPFKGIGADVGYHSPVPMREEQTKARDKCEFIGCACYSDGSAMRAQEWHDIWLKEGNDKIWSMLEEDWLERFGKDSK